MEGLAAPRLAFALESLGKLLGIDSSAFACSSQYRQNALSLLAIFHTIPSLISNGNVLAHKTVGRHGKIRLPQLFRPLVGDNPLEQRGGRDAAVKEIVESVAISEVGIGCSEGGFKDLVVGAD